MPIEQLHTFLVHPNKGVADPQAIGGANVPLRGEVFRLLSEVYSKAEQECRIDISFDHAADGRQQNDCRDLIMAYANAPSVRTGKPLATRLGGFTTKRSSLGLLFLATGMEGLDRKIVLARFAAHSGILADEDENALSVEFVEKVFLRHVGSYKSALYRDVLSPQAYWNGKVIDRQLNTKDADFSQYWVTDFLASDLLTTSAQGTRVLAAAMRDAARTSPNLATKAEIAASAVLGRNLNNQMLTASQFLDRFGLSPETRETVLGNMRHQGLMNDRFRFNADEFNRQLPYRTVALDSGAILTAAAPDFDRVFDRGRPDRDGRVTYSTTGRVIDDKLGRATR